MPLELCALRAASSGFFTDTNAPFNPLGGGTGRTRALPVPVLMPSFVFASYCAFDGAAAAMLLRTTEGGARRLAPPSPDRVRECPRGRSLALVKLAVVKLAMVREEKSKSPHGAGGALSPGGAHKPERFLKSVFRCTEKHDRKQYN